LDAERVHGHGYVTEEILTVRRRLPGHNHSLSEPIPRGLRLQPVQRQGNELRRHIGDRTIAVFGLELL
jgi:hypothetical protein